MMFSFLSMALATAFCLVFFVVTNALEYDINFHLEIARAAQNSILYNLVRTTRHYLQQWIKGSLETASSQAKDRACLSVAQHREIFAALTEKNPNMARECMRSHILSSSKDFQSRLAP